VKVTITFDADVPDIATPEELEQWVRFELHDINEMPISNPLSETELEAKFGSVRIE
jgi:hypothetical protein